MAITYVGSNMVAVRTDGGNLGTGIPASIQGDLVLVISGCSNNSAGPPSTSGYTLVSDQTVPTIGIRLCVYRKFMGASPDTQVIVTGTGDINHLGVLVLVFRGVNTATPIDVTVTTAFNNSTPSVPNPSAITPTSNDCCIVIAALEKGADASVGSVTNYLPSPSVQVSSSSGTNAISVAGGYRILSGGSSVSEDPLAWSTWSSANWATTTIALRALTASVEFVTVDPATITATGKSVTVPETTPVSKASVGYVGRTVTIPDGLVDNISVDKYRMVITGKTVEPFEIIRSVTVTQAAVLCRGRTVTPRDIQFEDIPRYAVRGRGSGHWMETR